MHTYVVWLIWIYFFYQKDDITICFMLYAIFRCIVCFKNSSDLSLFEQIVLVISKSLEILNLQPQISKVFLDHKNIFFLTIGQNNVQNKTLFLNCEVEKLVRFFFRILRSHWVQLISFLVGAEIDYANQSSKIESRRIQTLI